jgi:hypothetical protein
VLGWWLITGKTLPAAAELGTNAIRVSIAALHGASSAGAVVQAAILAA